MKLNCPIFFSTIVSLLTLALLCNCASTEPESGPDANETVHNADGKADFDDLSSLIEEAESGVSQDLESFLNEGDSLSRKKPSASSDPDLHSSESENDGLAHVEVNAPIDHLVSKGGSGSTAMSLEAYETEKALSNLEESTVSHQRSIDELRRINSRKDRTIASLTKLNRDLVTEVNRLKGSKDIVVPAIAESSGESPTGKLFGLKSEVKNLRGNLLIKSQEIQDLRIRNDSLEERISVLEHNPSRSFPTRSILPRWNRFSRRNRFHPCEFQTRMPLQLRKCLYSSVDAIFSLTLWLPR